jgi:hypothetical protein
MDRPVSGRELDVTHFLFTDSKLEIKEEAHGRMLWSDSYAVQQSHPLGDFEAAARCLSVVAALLYRNADNFGKKCFYYQASFRLIRSSSRKRTTIPINEAFSFSFPDCRVTA